VSASRPLAAVTGGGQDTVSRGSTSATAGSISGLRGLALRRCSGEGSTALAVTSGPGAGRGRHRHAGHRGPGDRPIWVQATRSLTGPDAASLTVIRGQSRGCGPAGEGSRMGPVSSEAASLRTIHGRALPRAGSRPATVHRRPLVVAAGAVAPVTG
jgi:hypothetical protein